MNSWRKMLPLTLNKGAEGGFKAQNCSYLMMQVEMLMKHHRLSLVWKAIGTAAFTVISSLFGPLRLLVTILTRSAKTNFPRLVGKSRTVLNGKAQSRQWSRAD